MEEFSNPTQEAQFNAGLAIAQHLHELFCAATGARLACDWGDLHKILNTAEIKLSAEFRDNAQAKEEIQQIKQKYAKSLEVFIRLHNIGKRPSWQIEGDVNIFLTEYESSLSYWRNKFGYGMPQKADAKAAAFR